MTSLRNISVSESAVYRGIHHRDQFQSHGDTGNEGGQGETSKWAFLTRLLEIEEVHEKRRRARERQERALRQATLKTLPIKDEVNKMEIDPMSKWLNGQILAQSAEDTSHTEAVHSSSKSAGHPRLPSVSAHFSPLLSSQLLAVSLSNSEFPTDTSNSEHKQISIANLNLPGYQAGPGEDVTLKNNFSSLTTTSQTELSNLQKSFSRPTTSVQNSRQLRLPPILLPRIYTVKPRPLKSLEFPAPTKMRGPITETEWEDLRDCRYIRHLTRRKPMHKGAL